MASVVINGDTSGSITLAAPATAGTNTITLPAQTGTSAVLSSAISAVGQIPFSTDGSTLTPTAKIVSGTAVASTSGTSITFSSIPSWVKRVTLILNGVSLSGSAYYIVQLGSGSATTTGYTASGGYGFQSGSTIAVNTTNGFNIQVAGGTPASSTTYGTMTFTNVSGNIWIASGSGGYSVTSFWSAGGAISLAGVLDRVIVTTSNGTDTFDAGSVNILYE